MVFTKVTVNIYYDADSEDLVATYVFPTRPTLEYRAVLKAVEQFHDEITYGFSKSPVDYRINSVKVLYE